MSNLNFFCFCNANFHFHNLSLSLSKCFFFFPAPMLIFSQLYLTTCILVLTTTYIQFLRVCFVLKIYFILGFGLGWIYALFCPWRVDYVYFGLSELVGLTK